MPVGFHARLAKERIFFHGLTFAANVVSLLAASAALEDQGQIAAQQTDRLALLWAGHRTQQGDLQLGGVAEIIIIVQGKAGRQCAKLCVFPHLAAAAQKEGTHVSAAFQPDLAQKGIQRLQCGGQGHIQIQPIYLLICALHPEKHAFLTVRLLTGMLG